ncbi:MAG: hypothetical protein FJZ43_00015 [Candidatus Staskawiczbacteria bacterium]|nr:hypothetical protein [Candidatus Staskawiczbacteria bacterium]
MDYSLGYNSPKNNIFNINGSTIASFLNSKFLLYIIVALLLIRILLTLSSIPFPGNIFFADITKAELLNLLNSDREKLGLNTLSQNNELDNAAHLKAQDMIRNGYFAHQSPSGITPWFWFAKAGYSYKYAGENLAIGFTDSKNVYDAWVDSPSHKDNLFNPNYNEIGTAVLQGFGENSAILVVQLFGSPKPKATSESVVEANKNIVPKSTDTPEVVKKSDEIKSIAEENNLLDDSQNVIANTDKIGLVLSRTTRYSIFSAPNNNSGDSYYLRFLNILVYNNNTILQYTLYLLVTTIAGCLIIVLKQKNNHSLILRRSIIMIIAIVFSIILGNEAISNLINYNAIVV